MREQGRMRASRNETRLARATLVSVVPERPLFCEALIRRCAPPSPAKREKGHASHRRGNSAAEIACSAAPSFRLNASAPICALTTLILSSLGSGHCATMRDAPLRSRQRLQIGLQLFAIGAGGKHIGDPYVFARRASRRRNRSSARRPPASPRAADKKTNASANRRCTAVSRTS